MGHLNNLFTKMPNELRSAETYFSQPYNALVIHVKPVHVPVYKLKDRLIEFDSAASSLLRCMYLSRDFKSTFL